MADGLEAKGRKRIFPPLSKRQKRCLDLIVRHRKRTQLSPTYPELAAQMGITVQTLKDHLARLEKKGRIVKLPGARAIVVIRVY